MCWKEAVSATLGAGALAWFGMDQSKQITKAIKKIKQDELPVPTPPPATATPEEAKAVSAKLMALQQGQQALAADRSGTLMTSPLGVAGFQLGQKKKLLGQ